MSVHKNLTNTQNLFCDLSLKTKSSSKSTSPLHQQQQQKTSSLSSSSSTSKTLMYKESPEIHDLIRFQNAIMLKYIQTQDEHFKNMAKALKPQIEDKIREFNKINNNGRI